MVEVCTLRVRIDRKTGKEISRETFNYREISEEEYARKMCWFLTGMCPEDAARDCLDWIYEQRKTAGTLAN